MTTTITDFSTSEVVEATGITYRTLDMWIRNGYITISRDGNGSGSRRRVSPAEVAAIGDLVAARDQAAEVFESIRTGALFAARLAHHLGLDTDPPPSTDRAAVMTRRPSRRCRRFIDRGAS